MAANFWNSIGNTNWRRVWLCSTAAMAAWAGFAAVIPSKYHLWVTAILGGCSVGVGIMIRGTKYIRDREEELPGPGVTP